MAIVKLNGQDPVVNRFADNVRDTVNPLIKKVDEIKPAAVAAAPSADANRVGQITVVAAAGTASIVKICVQNSTGAYEWLTLGTSS
jgi:hypothetical protein